MLENDRHLVGKAALDRCRRDDAGRLGLERDVEMMVADEPGPRGVGKNLAYHGAQRVLHQEVVADEIGRHEKCARAMAPQLTDRSEHCNVRRGLR